MSGFKEVVVREFGLQEARSLRRSYGLDVIRAVAILLVVSCHSLNFIPKPNSKLYYYGSGFLGVELFFVLSGYLIGSILLKILLDEGSDRPLAKRLGEFWIRRWFRTLPNYYLFLGVNFAVFSIGLSRMGPYSEYFYFGQNFLHPVGALMNESWSLAVEEWFYISFPIALGLFALLFGRSVRAFLLTALIYIVFFGWLRVLTIDAGLYEHWDSEIRKIVVLRLDSIAFGALVMVLMKGWPGLMFKLRKVLFGCGLAGIGLVVFILDRVLDDKMSSALHGSFFSLTNLSFALLLPLAVYATRSSGHSRLRTFIATTSLLSYSMYLLHLNMVRFVLKFFGHWLWFAQFVLYWTLCFLVSYLVYVLYERRMTRLRDRFSNRETGAVDRDLLLEKSS